MEKDLTCRETLKTKVGHVCFSTVKNAVKKKRVYYKSGPAGEASCQNAFLVRTSVWDT